MDVTAANLVPQLATTPQQARALVALDGAALVAGIASENAALCFGRSMLGERAVSVRSQFDATKERQNAEVASVAAQPIDDRGRKRYHPRHDEIQPAHNDGFSFGDHAPDYMFLYCERPCTLGGTSFLIDALKLATIVASEDRAFGRFCWEVPIDHSVPNFPQASYAPIARQVAGGRVQVRCHPDLAPEPGPFEDDHWPMLRKWLAAVEHARDRGPRFAAKAGDLICIDNYRMLHGRTAYADANRKMVSIWAWSTDAVAMPAGELDLVTPNLAALRAS